MMKKIILVLVSIIFIACSKDDDNADIPVTEKNVVISQDEIYEYEFEFPGDESGYSITTQAENFELSSLEQNPATGGFIYNYKTQADFTGTDFVEISLTTYTIGLDKTSVTRIIRINFEIQNKSTGQ
ncbi:hypothetical protein [Salegentibacter mishustinae]|uniref:hypothetical protein n=1 Tax=Salegentibacter mishustinae TaxID=270918 RepID=UPI002493CF40|nr:hypothetical protein [Salegentibacter mishustinae]